MGRKGQPQPKTVKYRDPRMGTCFGCSRPSLTLYCDACAPAPAHESSTADRRWNGESLKTVACAVHPGLLNR